MMLFASAVLLLSSYAVPCVSMTGDTSVEQMGVTYGQGLDEMVVSFASFSERDEEAECKYGNSVDDLR